MPQTAISAEACTICGASMSGAFSARILGKYAVQYFSCPSCAHFRTETPYWLEQAYSSAIAGADTGLVVRNLQISQQLVRLLDALFPGPARFLDTAGGTGLLVRLMRDAGFDFYWEDPYCQNSLAAGFEAIGDERYAAVTAFEALEHMQDPMTFIKAALERSESRTFIFTTELFPSPLPRNDWPYLAYATGQHISFFCKQTLGVIAEKLQLRLYSAAGLHMLSPLEIDPTRYRQLVNIRPGRICRMLCVSAQQRISERRGSFTQTDSELMLRRSEQNADSQSG